MEVRFIPHNLINTAMWDSCIENSMNGCIFAYSWYLNYACQEWNALIADDYKYVMPLPLEKKWGANLVRTPDFIEYLGIFGQNPILPEIFALFEKAIPREYGYIGLVLNKLTIIRSEKNSNGLHWNRALEIDLISNYSIIQKKYSAQLKEVLDYNKSFNFVSGIQLIDFLQLYNKNASNATYILSNDHLRRLRKICLHALRENSADIIGAYDNKNNLWAAMLFVSSHNKAFPIFYVHTKNAENMHFYEFMIDFFIRKHSEKNLNLCVFEKNNNSSAICSFGGHLSSYPVLQLNRLSFLAKFLLKFSIVTMA